MVKHIVSRIIVLSFLLILSCAAAFPVCAANLPDGYPDRPITFIVPSGPGGNYDNFARVIASNSGAYIDMPIVIKNVPGGLFTIGMQQCVDSEPDGYTLLGSTEDASVYGTYFLETNFTVDDVEYIVGMCAGRHTLSVPADSPFKDIEELMAYAKEHPGELSCGSSSAIFECWMMALKDHGYEFNVIPFPTGSAATAAVAGGHVDCAIVSISGIKPLHEGGQVRILYVGDDLTPLNPPTKMYSDVPWLAEILKGLNVGTLCIKGPKGIPEERIAFLEDMFEKMWNNPEFQTMAANLGLDPVWVNHEDLQEIMANVDRVVSDLTQRHGVQKQAQ